MTKSSPDGEDFVYEAARVSDNLLPGGQWAPLRKFERPIQKPKRRPGLRFGKEETGSDRYFLNFRLSRTACASQRLFFSFSSWPLTQW